MSKYGMHMTRGRWIFQKIQELPQSSRYHKNDMKQVPYLGPTNIRCHCTRFILPGDQTPWICAPLFMTAHTVLTVAWSYELNFE
jgi:hypothetical protein